MSKVEYYEDTELTKLVKSIIGDTKKPALNAIREQDLKIVPIVKSRTNKEDEHEQNPGPPAKIQKVNDLWRLFTDAHYLLIVDYYFFKHANCVEAGIFNALCEVEVTVKDGAVKLATKKPEIHVFTATLQEYGAFDETLLALREWMNTAKTKAAKSFVEKVSTGNLETSAAEPPSTESDEPPRVHAGVPEEQTAPTRRGGRTKR
jgi:hypothetical protein